MIQPGTCSESIQSQHQELANLETRIRNVIGFEQFQWRSSYKYFTSLARSGPIVSFNITEIRSDAFIVTNKGVKVLNFELKHLAHDIVKENAKLLTGPESVLVNREAEGGPTWKKRNEQLRSLLKWLWEVAVKPLLEVLDLVQPAKCEDVRRLPRLWWATSRILRQFPLHSAGSKWARSTGNTMSHVCSSYVSSFRALEYARGKARGTAKSFVSKTMIVTMPKTTGMNNFTVDDELAVLK